MPSGSRCSQRSVSTRPSPAATPLLTSSRSQRIHDARCGLLRRGARFLEPRARHLVTLAALAAPRPSRAPTGLPRRHVVLVHRTRVLDQQLTVFPRVRLHRPLRRVVFDRARSDSVPPARRGPPDQGAPVSLIS